MSVWSQNLDLISLLSSMAHISGVPTGHGHAVPPVAHQNYLGIGGTDGVRLSSPLLIHV